MILLGAQSVKASPEAFGESKLFSQEATEKNEVLSIGTQTRSSIRLIYEYLHPSQTTCTDTRIVPGTEQQTITTIEEDGTTYITLAPGDESNTTVMPEYNCAVSGGFTENSDKTILGRTRIFKLKDGRTIVSFEGRDDALGTVNHEVEYANLALKEDKRAIIISSSSHLSDGVNLSNRYVGLTNNTNSPYPVVNIITLSDTNTAFTDSRLGGVKSVNVSSSSRFRL